MIVLRACDLSRRGQYLCCFDLCHTDSQAKARWSKKEVVRFILGASRWTKTLNLRIEANFLPLDNPIYWLFSFFLSSFRFNGASNWITSCLANCSWLPHTVWVLVRFQLREALLVDSLDYPRPDYLRPWGANMIEISVVKLDKGKGPHSQPRMKTEAERIIENITSPRSNTY